MDSTQDSASKQTLGDRYSMSLVRRWMRNHPGKALDFAFGGMPPKPPAEIVELIREQSELMLRPASPQQIERFCALASGMMRREYDVEVSPDCILPAPSGRAAISALAAWALEPEDRVLVTEPTYPVFARVAAQHHARVVVAQLDPRREFEPDLGSIGPDAPAIRIAAFNYPNNPTGATIPEQTMAELGRLLPEDSILFNDATYGPLTYDVPPRSLLAGVTEQPVIELHSLSKLFGLGPLSVSFLAGDKSTINSLRGYCEFIWPSASSLNADVASRCVEDASHIESLRLDTRERILQLRRTLVKAGFDPYPTPSGQYVLCRATAGLLDPPLAGAWPMAQTLLSDFGLAVMPWQTASDGYLRFSARYRPDELAALAALGVDRRRASA